MSLHSSSKEALPILCEWDAIKVIRNPDGTWICKAWAMRGPTGSMMDKEIPEKYAAEIEKDYQKSIKNSEERFSKIRVLGRMNGDSLIKAEPRPEPKRTRLKSKSDSDEKVQTKGKKRKAKVPKDSTIEKKPKNKKQTMGGAFNPFK
jgi:hypothetical protein